MKLLYFKLNYFIIYAIISIITCLNLVSFNSLTNLLIFFNFNINYLYILIILVFSSFFLNRKHNLPPPVKLYLIFLCTFFVLSLISFFISIFIFPSIVTYVNLVELYKYFIISSLTFLVCGTYVYNQSLIQFNRVLFLVVTVFSVGNYLTIYQYITQSDWLNNTNSSNEGWITVPRASGLYLNPNAAGYAAIIGLMVSLTYLISPYKKK